MSRRRTNTNPSSGWTCPQPPLPRRRRSLTLRRPRQIRPDIPVVTNLDLRADLPNACGLTATNVCLQAYQRVHYTASQFLTIAYQLDAAENLLYDHNGPPPDESNYTTSGGFTVNVLLLAFHGRHLLMHHATPGQELDNHPHISACILHKPGHYIALVWAGALWELWDSGRLIQTIRSLPDFLQTIPGHTLFWVVDRLSCDTCQDRNVVRLGCGLHHLCHSHYQSLVTAAVCIDGCPTFPYCTHPSHPDIRCGFCGQGRFQE